MEITWYKGRMNMVDGVEQTSLNPIFVVIQSIL